MEECGIKVNDVLVEVDGRSVANLSAEQAANLLKGPVDSNIQLKLTRGDSNVQIAGPRVAMKSAAAAPTAVPAAPAISRNPLAQPEKVNPLAFGAEKSGSAATGTYSDPQGRWSIDIPSGWTRQENAAEQSVTFADPATGAAIRVRLVSVASPFKTRYEVSMCDHGLKWLGNDIEFDSSSSEKPLGNVKACLVRFSTVEDGVPLLGKGYYAISGSEGLVIRLTVPKANAREGGPKLDQVANSMKIAAR